MFYWTGWPYTLQSSRRAETYWEYENAQAKRSSELNDLSADAVRDIGAALNALLADMFAL